MMKTQRNSASELELVLNPYLQKLLFLSVFLVGCWSTYLIFIGSEPIWIKLVILIFPAIGLMMLLSLQTVSILCNKTTNRVVITRKSFLSQTEERLSFNKIKDIVIQETTGNKNKTIYRIAMILDDQREVPITQTYNSDLACKIKAAQTLADFFMIKIDLTELVKKERKLKRLGKTMFFIGLIPMVIIFPVIFRQIANLFN